MNNTQLSQQYNNFASKFSEVSLDMNESSRENYRAQLPEIKNKIVLDMACGDGADCAFLLKSGAKEVVGLDASNELIQISQKKYPSIKFVNGVFEKLPFEDNSFDVILSKYAIQTSKDLESVFKEVQRVLKPGGKFMFLTVHPIRQLYEKKQARKDYFERQIVDSVCFDGKMVFKEPTHTLKEYFSEFMTKNFRLDLFDEQFDPAAEKIVDTYPGYMILKWAKK